MLFSRLFAMPKFSCRRPFDKPFASHAAARAIPHGIAAMGYPFLTSDRNHHNGDCRRLSFIQALAIGLPFGSIARFCGI